MIPDTCSFIVSRRSLNIMNTSGDPVGYRILVLDDEDIVGKGAAGCFADYDCEVAEASYGEEAIDLYKKAMQLGWKFDAVILDPEAPGTMNCEELLRRLLDIDPDITAIAATRSSDPGISAKYERYGFSEVLPKPCTAHEFAEIVFASIYKSNNPKRRC